MKVIKTQRHEYQQAFIDRAKTHRYAAFFGGLQSGKSVAGADALYEGLYVAGWKLPPQTSGRLSPEVWICSKSHALAYEAWSYFGWRAADAIYSAAECKNLGLSREDHTEWLRPGADLMPIRCRMRTAKDPEQLRATGRLIAAWGDEIAHWPELAWLNLQGRGVVTPTRYLLTTTPKGKNWLYRDVFMSAKQGDAGYSVTTCRSVDNPWADAKYIEKLRLKFGKEYAEQELDALFTSNIGYVYADFDRLAHMVAPPSDKPEDYRVTFAGADPGTSDPFSVSIMGLDWDGNFWLLDEFYRTGGTATHWAGEFAALQAKWKCRAWFVDKRQASEILDLQKQGLNAMGNLDIHYENERGTIRPMIGVVRELLRAGKLHIAPHCEWTAEEFENYAYKDQDESDPKNRGEVPIDYANHAMDSLRYAVCSVVEGGIPGVKLWYDRGEKERRVKRPGEILKPPTIAESIQAQDEREASPLTQSDRDEWTPVR